MEVEKQALIETVDVRGAVRDSVLLPVVVALATFDQSQGMDVSRLFMAGVKSPTGSDRLTGLGKSWLCEVEGVAARGLDFLHELLAAACGQELYDRTETLLIAVAAVANDGEARGANGPLSALQCLHDEAHRLLKTSIRLVDEAETALSVAREAKEVACV